MLKPDGTFILNIKESGEWGTPRLCAGTDLGNAQAGLAVDGGVPLAQAELSPRKMAQPLSGCLGAVLAMQQNPPIQDVSRCGDGPRGRLGEDPFEKLG